jgi:hypothetical protein
MAKVEIKGTSTYDAKIIIDDTEIKGVNFAELKLNAVDSSMSLYLNIHVDDLTIDLDNVDIEGYIMRLSQIVGKKPKESKKDPQIR